MKAKFNAMDFIIILAVVLVAAAAAYFFISSTAADTDASNTVGRSVTATVEVEFSDEDEFLTELPQEGDKVTIGEKEKMPAVVTGVRYETAKTTAYDLTKGAAMNQEIPGKYDVYVTMEADAVDGEDAVTINNSPIRVGDATAVRTQNWANYGYVTRLEISE